MAFIIRRKDVPAYEGGRTFWITVGRRETDFEARKLINTLKLISKPGTKFWYGDESNETDRN